MVPGGKCAVIVPVKRGLHWVEKNTWRRHELLKFNCWKKICFSSFLKILDISVVNHFIHFFLWSSVLSQLSVFSIGWKLHMAPTFFTPKNGKKTQTARELISPLSCSNSHTPRMERSDVHSSYNSTELSCSHIFTQEATTAQENSRILTRKCNG